MTPAPAASSPLTRRLATAALAVPLGLLLVGVMVAERRDWPSFVGDEATYLMAAESLAWDLDLLFERGDYDRFVDHWGQRPAGLILQSGNGGRSLTFSKPFFYPAYLAAFVRVAPRRGAFVANVLILALSALLAARTLRRWVGDLSALWIAVFIFASAAFVYAFWAHADLFLMALTAISLSLAFSDPEGRPTRAGLAKWLLCGVLLAAVAFSRPFYLPLLIPAAFCAPRPRRPRLAAYGAGVLLLVGLSLAIHQGLGDTWTSYDGERASFYDETGYPEVDFPRQDWNAFIGRWGNFAWSPETVSLSSATSLRVWLWNGLYFLIGRHVGVLVYFLPLVLGLAAGPKDHPRWALALAIAAAIAGAFFLRPFNFFGGGASIANRFFLPVYPAFWLLAGGPLKPRWLAGTALVSGLFIWPLWLDPGGYVVRADGSYRYVSPAAATMLPVETTQSLIQPGGGDVRQNGLWIRPLGSQIRVLASGELSVDGGARAELLVGGPHRLDEIDLVIVAGRGVTLGGEPPAPGDSRHGDRPVFRLDPGSPRAVHPTWWSAAPIKLYRLELQLDSTDGGPIAFRLEPSERDG